MALDVSGLSLHVKNDSFKIATKAVAGAKLAQSLINSGNYQSGIKGFAPILKMDSTVNFSSGASCGRNVIGDTTLSDKLLQVVAIKDNQNICPKVLYNTYFGAALAKGQDPQGETISGEVVDKIVEKRVQLVNKAVEDLLWKGQKSITGTTSNLRFIDGIKEQAKTANGGHDVTVTGSTIQKLQALFLATPVEVRTAEDFKIYLGEDTYAKYLIELATANIYKPTEDMKLFGTTAMLFPTSGLNGAGEAYAMKEDNLQLGMDGDSEQEKFSLTYSIETENWYQDVHFAVGISVVYPEQVYFTNDLAA